MDAVWELIRSGFSWADARVAHADCSAGACGMRKLPERHRQMMRSRLGLQYFCSSSFISSLIRCHSQPQRQGRGVSSDLVRRRGGTVKLAPLGAPRARTGRGRGSRLGRKTSSRRSARPGLLPGAAGGEAPSSSRSARPSRPWREGVRRGESRCRIQRGHPSSRG